ncbi:MAG: TrkA family potassium uptake protein [Paludibacter sp.]|nr:TrkA family potassium uptake protein [Paludibacter sp.]
MTYIILGLGNFGSALAERLTAMGHEVVATDKNMQRVEEFKNTVTVTMCLDVTDARAFGMLPLKQAEIVYVTMGEDFGASIHAVAILKQLGVKKIIARATTKLHKAVLESLGVYEIVIPEDYAADLLANAADYEPVRASHALNESYRFVESDAPSILFKQKIKDINFEKTFDIKLVGIKRPKADKNLIGKSSIRYEVFVPEPTGMIEKDDILLLFGTITALKRFWKEA